MEKRTLLFRFLLVAFFIGTLNAESPPDPSNMAAQGQGIVGLDFSSSGNNQQIGLFIINVNDTPGSYYVRFEFTNYCQFKCQFKFGALAIPMTDLVWKYVSGALGSGLTEPVDKDIFNNRIEGGFAYEWVPQGTGQKSSTVNYIMELRATWNTPARMLSGFYFETITATVIAK